MNMEEKNLCMLAIPEDALTSYFPSVCIFAYTLQYGKGIILYPESSGHSLSVRAVEFIVWSVGFGTRCTLKRSQLQTEGLLSHCWRGHRQCSETSVIPLNECSLLTARPLLRINFVLSFFVQACAAYNSTAKYSRLNRDGKWRI